MTIEILREKLNVISNSIPKKHWKYFNKRTVENYINSWDFIIGKIDKVNTLIILSNYLNDVELNFDPNIYYSISLYNKYLYQLKNVYRELGFALVPSIRYLYGLIIIIIIIGFLIKNYFYLEVFYLSTLAVIFIRMLIKL